MTLIEVCAVLAIVAVLVACALGSWHAGRQLRHLEAAALELRSDLQTLRAEALSRSAPLRLELNLSGTRDSCYVLHNGASGDCSCNASGSAQCKAGVDMVKVVGLKADKGSLALTRNSSIQWSPSRGTVSPTATLKLVLPDGRAIHHVVNILGRVRSCSPEARVAGYAAC